MKGLKTIKIRYGCSLLLIVCASKVLAEEPMQLDTTIIRANKELPKVMYMVPWQQQKENRKVPRQRLKLHSLFGNVFDPVYPTEAVQP